VVAWLFIFSFVGGIIYGVTTRKYRNDGDVANAMSEAMKTLGVYMVLVFFAAQFVAYFKWSNLGLIMAIKGAGVLTALNVGLIPLIILFIIFAATMNMFMGSASAKWALLAPIFIPIFMFMGYSPELAQVVYRIGDSVTNIVSPMMSFFALIIAFIQKYDKKAGIGTVIATMLPYSIAFFIVWTILMVFWVWLGLPLGPDAGLYYTG
jgi:aminobenzoyl-glutamate transport protein